MSCERETDRLEIIELTQTLSQERRKRDVEKQLIDELKQQVRRSYSIKETLPLPQPANV